MDAGLKKAVTDSGLAALAFAGCGAQLTSLTLQGDLVIVVGVWQWIDMFVRKSDWSLM